MANRTRGLIQDHKRSEVKEVMSPDLLFNSSFDILFDAFAVKDVPALRLNGVLRNIVANAADRGFPDVFCFKRVRVRFALEDEIGMTSHLPHSGKTAQQVNTQNPQGTSNFNLQAEDVRVIWGEGEGVSDYGMFPWQRTYCSTPFRNPRKY